MKWVVQLVEHSADWMVKMKGLKSVVKRVEQKARYLVVKMEATKAVKWVEWWVERKAEKWAVSWDMTTVYCLVA